MTAKHKSLPEALLRHLSANSASTTMADYLEQGAELVTSEAIDVLRGQHKALHEKIAALGESERLRSRLELLAAVVEETDAAEPVSPRALQEITFALLYFLQSADRIPDDVPQIGLLDDAVIIQFVLQRQAAVVGAWARRRGWALPSEVT